MCVDAYITLYMPDLGIFAYAVLKSGVEKEEKKKTKEEMRRAIRDKVGDFAVPKEILVSYD